MLYFCINLNMSSSDNDAPTDAERSEDIKPTKKTLKNLTSSDYSTTSDEPLEEEPEPKPEPEPTDAEFKDLKKELPPTMQKEPFHNKGDIHNKIISGEQEKPQPAEAPTDARNEVRQTPETDETRIIHRETTLSTNEIMENYNKIIDEFYKDNDAEKYFKRIRYLTLMLPDSKFDEVAEAEATKLAQMNMNGVKLFKDIAEARQFLYDLRYGRNRTFKGQHQKVYKLPKLQKMIKHSNQTNQTISPMMLRNIKPSTRTNNIYEY